MTMPRRFAADVWDGLLAVLGPVDDALFGWSYHYRARRWQS